MYWLGFPGLISDPHPGPVRRLGKSQGSLLFKPNGSPSVPKVAEKGTPSLALKMPPSSQPLASQVTGPETPLRLGTCQVLLITRVRLMLKSDRPRLIFKLNQCRLGIEFP